MAQSSSLISGVAERYAQSLFELAEETGAADQVEAELVALQGLIDSSPDLQRLIASPVFSADDQLRAISAIADKAGLVGLTGNFLRVVARNRRLFAIPGMIRAYRQIAAKARGEVTAEVVSARALGPEELEELRAALRTAADKDVSIHAKVDPSLLGGLVVRLGSRQIDTSLRTKLNMLELALKEVG